MLNTLGLACRAKKIVSGEDFVVEGIRNGSVKLVFLASDAGMNTKKTITDKAKYYNVQVIDRFLGDDISRAIGKKNRKVVGIIDQGFAKLIKGKDDING